MENFDPGNLLIAIAGLASFSQVSTPNKELLCPNDNYEDQKRQITLICADLERLNLDVALITAQELKKIIYEEAKPLAKEHYGFAAQFGLSGDRVTSYDVRAISRFDAHIRTLKDRVRDEFGRYDVFCLDSQQTKWFRQKEPLFGAMVDAQFPSCRIDIEESAKCLAFERGTGCVMHLMRVLEAGLKALASTVEIKESNDWGTYIREINNKLDNMAKQAGKRTPDEQFYSEAAFNFDRLRRAFRNPSMHLEKFHEYSEARDIFEALRVFMNHLSKKLKENP